MEFLGIGPLELFFIILIALIVLGPKDMVKAGRTIGRFLRTLVTSPTWKTIQQTSRDLRYLPNRLMREAGLEDLKGSLPEGQTIRKEMGLDQMESDMKQWQKEVGGWTKGPNVTVDAPSLPESVSTSESKLEQPAEPPSHLQAQEETPHAPDLSAWTTPVKEVDAGRDGNDPAKPASNSNPDELNSKSTP
jgi:Sec-independent protein translocase protein TatA